MENNFLSNESKERKDNLTAKGLHDALSLEEKKELIVLERMNQMGDEYLDKYRQDPDSLTPQEANLLNRLLNQYRSEMLKSYDEKTVNGLMQGLLAEGATFRDYGFPYAASSDLKLKVAQAEKEGMTLWQVLNYSRDLSPEEKLYKQSLSDLNAWDYHEYWGKVGEPALNLLPGAPGLIVNGLDAAIGGAQFGKGLNQIINDGVSAEAVGNITGGILTAGPAVGGGVVKQGGKPNNGILHGEGSNVWQSSTIGNTFVKSEGVLSGAPTKIETNMSKENIRSLNRENESAQILSQHGFYVEQNPVTLGRQNPDYMINGEIFDNYAPSSNRVRNIWTEVKGKIDEGQTTNVVINLSDTKVSLVELQKQFNKWPIMGMDKLILIDQSGQVIRVK